MNSRMHRSHAAPRNTIAGIDLAITHILQNEGENWRDFKIGGEQP
jgi:hypothetical protein